MKIGISALLTDLSIRPDDLARESEARGFESLWFADHSYIPVEEFKGSDVRPASHLRTEFHSCLEQLTNVATAAAVTKTIKVATGMCLMTLRDPLITAKALASIDYLSGGRLLVGVGAGWHTGEAANHGTEYKTRLRKMSERVKAMQQVWANEKYEFHGDYVNFCEVWCKPKPAQRPGPPIIAGMDGELGMERMTEWANGWCPSPLSLPNLEQKLERVRGNLRKAGRDPNTFSISIFYNNGWQNTDIQSSEIDRMARLGLERVVLNVPPLSKSEVTSILDKYARLVR